ncbi:MAG TPA: LamG domain-containing protein [Kofleriaceae bacterium]|nr:LamG domain-containing protein [Kofleriaceae bacterium]
MWLGRLAVLIALGGCGRHSFATVDGAAGGSDAPFIPAMPIAAYALNEGVGQNAASSVTTPMVNAVLGNSAGADGLDPTWTTGRFGGGLLFDATDDRATIAYAPAGYFQTSSNNDGVSASAWIFPMGAGTTYRVVYEIGGESNGVSLGITATGILRCALRNSTAVQRSKVLDSTRTIATGVWSYVVCTSDAAGMNLFIYDNAGTAVDMTSASGPYIWRTGNDGIAIGNNPADNSGLRGMITAGPEPFTGIVDEVRVYDRAISTAQIEYDLATALP